MCIKFTNDDIYFDLNCTNIRNFHPLEVLDRDSETKLQVGENLNYLM